MSSNFHKIITVQSQILTNTNSSTIQTLNDLPNSIIESDSLQHLMSNLNQFNTN